MVLAIRQAPHPRRCGTGSFVRNGKRYSGTPYRESTMPVSLPVSFVVEVKIGNQLLLPRIHPHCSASALDVDRVTIIGHATAVPRQSPLRSTFLKMTPLMLPLPSFCNC